MSGFICPSCNTESDIFGMGTCEELATQYNTQVLEIYQLNLLLEKVEMWKTCSLFSILNQFLQKRYMMAADKLIQFLESIDDNINNSAIQPNYASRC